MTNKQFAEALVFGGKDTTIVWETYRGETVPQVAALTVNGKYLWVGDPNHELCGEWVGPFAEDRGYRAAAWFLGKSIAAKSAMFFA